MKTFKHIAFTALVLFAGGIVLSSCKKTEAETKREEIFSVQTATVENAPMAATFKATGTLEGIREATVNSETQGRILNVSVQNGSRVGQGSALVHVDNELKAISLKQAEAGRMTAEASLEKAKLDLGRTQQLAKENAATKSQLEMAELQVKSADAQLRAAESGESFAKRQLADATVKAPFSGTVAMRYVNQGELLNPGAKVAMIVDDSKMKLRINIGELDVPLIKIGDDAIVTVDAIGGTELKGKITTIASKADVARAYIVEVEIPNSDKKLKSGMFARAEIKREAARDVPTVPTKALIINGQRTQIYVAHNGIAELKAVKTGAASAERTEITEGLKDGDIIVTFGQNQLVDGAKIKVVTK